jgi:GntR family transcriptional regulator, transcriptional repressor for pyruvate dehydrogenase complex
LDIDRGEELDRSATTEGTALSSQIFRRIRQWIREGKLKEGDLLPSERELALLFDVSRVPIREALKVLEFTGVAQHVRGKGVFIKKIDVNNLISNIDFVLMDRSHTLLDLFEAREGIEIQAASLAALRWDEADMNLMEAAIATMERRLREGSSIIETSMSFHTAVIAASHNRAIWEINAYLSDWLRAGRETIYRRTTLHEEGLRNHKDILEKIRLRDSDGAAASMKEHLLRSRRLIEESVTEPTGTAGSVTGGEP